MTVEEMILEVYSQLGKPTDLRPLDGSGENVDLNSSGAQRILGWLNRGYRRILTWRFPNGRIVRFRTMERKLYFRTGTVSGTATAGTDTTVTLAAPAVAEANRYVGWIVEVVAGTGIGQRRKIMAYTAGRVATVHKDWDVVPDATSEYRLAKNFYLYRSAASAVDKEHIALSPVENIMAVMRVTDMDTGAVLPRADRTSSFEDSVMTIGIPSLFQDWDDGLYFDVAVDGSRYYELRYHGFPESLSALEQQPAVPPQFHEAILLWAVWWGLRRYQEFAGAYSTKRDLNDTMSTALQQFAMGSEREDISLYMEDDRYGTFR